VHCADALLWLKEAPALAASFVASMPDISEFSGWSVPAWQEWFISTARLILSRTDPEGLTVFYQSDIKVEGLWVDKGFLVQRAAELEGHQLLWHKIACRVQPGQVTYGRPSYSHILCFSRNIRLDPGSATADVIPDLGEKTWERGMGLQACLMIAAAIRQHTKTTTVVNPFCGEGSMLAAANALGLDAVGVERSPKRAERSRLLQVQPDRSGWIQAADRRPY
jgi:hypothetical protein